MTSARVSKTLQSNQVSEENPLDIKVPNNSPDPSPREEEAQNNNLPQLVKNSPRRLSLGALDEPQISPRTRELKILAKLNPLLSKDEEAITDYSDEKRGLAVRKKSSGSFSHVARKNSGSFVIATTDTVIKSPRKQ